MNKITIIILAALAFTMVACTESPMFWEQPNNVRVVAHTESVASSSLVWDAGAKLAVIDEDGVTHAFNIENGGNNNATFYTYDWSGKTPKYAVYPHVPGVSGTAVSLSPEYAVHDVEQCASFAAVDTLIGSGNVYKVLSMKNIMGIIKVTVDKPSVTSVTIESIGGEPLAGGVLVDYEKLAAGEGNFWQAIEGKASSSVTIVPAAGSKAAEEDGTFAVGDYYVSVLPQTFMDGLKITMGYADAEPMTVSREVPITVLRNAVFDIDEMLPDDITITIPFLNEKNTNPLGQFIPWASQTAAGADYKLAYDFLYGGKEMTHEFIFTIYGGTKYSYEAKVTGRADKMLYIPQGGKWAIKLPAVKNRYLKSVSFHHVGTTYARNFRLQEGYPTAGHYFTANSAATSAAEGVTATIDIPTTATSTAQLKETKMGVAYYVQLISNAVYNVAKIEVTYTREKPSRK